MYDHYSMMEAIDIGARLCSDGHFGTVLYKGSVTGTKGDWLGVEWDDPSRGKHDGSHEGQRYFTASHPTSGSFIRLKKANFGVPLMLAVQERYGVVEDENAGVITDDMFVIGKNQQQTTVEVVGARSVNLKQSKLDRLREVILRDTLINGAGPDNQIASSIPSTRELDISKSLLPSWKEVARITRQLLHLASLNVSDNKLEFPDRPEELQIQEAFITVQTLYINRMNYTWDQVVTCCHMMRELQHLHACFNQISQLCNIADIVPNLSLVNLESNIIEDWQQVLMLGDLQNLETLILNSTGLSRIYFPDVEFSQKTKYFPKLNSLSVSRCKLSELASLNELDKLQSLRELRLRNNPELQSDSLSVETLRTIMISKIAGLLYLNGTKVMATERRGSELDYLKMNGKSWKDAGGHQDPALNKPNLEFCTQHPRFQHLLDKYGAPEDHELVVGSSALKNSLISVSINCPESPEKPVLQKKLPVTMTVQKLKILLQRLYKVDVYMMKLTYTSTQMPDREIDIDNDLKDIGYYSIEEGDTLHVKW